MNKGKKRRLAKDNRKAFAKRERAPTEPEPRAADMDLPAQLRIGEADDEAWRAAHPAEWFRDRPRLPGEFGDLEPHLQTVRVRWRPNGQRTIGLRHDVPASN